MKAKTEILRFPVTMSVLPLPILGVSLLASVSEALRILKRSITCCTLFFPMGVVTFGFFFYIISKYNLIRLFKLILSSVNILSILWSHGWNICNNAEIAQKSSTIFHFKERKPHIKLRKALFKWVLERNCKNKNVLELDVEKDGEKYVQKRIPILLRKLWTLLSSYQ